MKRHTRKRMEEHTLCFWQTVRDCNNDGSRPPRNSYPGQSWKLQDVAGKKKKKERKKERRIQTGSEEAYVGKVTKIVGMKKGRKKAGKDGEENRGDDDQLVISRSIQLRYLAGEQPGISLLTHSTEKKPIQTKPSTRAFNSMIRQQ